MKTRAKVVLLTTAVVGLAVVCCVGGTAAFFLDGLGGDQNNKPAQSLGCGTNMAINVNQNLPSISTLSQDQIHNAAVIISVGQQMQIPPRGWVIAIATALQESDLNNLGDLGARNDHDSLGLFQQRPSSGWGTPAQIMDPVYASQKFYAKLLTIKGWQTRALTDVAQAVQISAFPDAYAKHEPLATLVVNQLANGAARADGSLSSLRCTQPGEIAASGWTVPVKGKITSTFRPPDRPTHNGVDIGADKGTEIVAAAAGTVTVVRCQVTTQSGGPWSCDKDGGIDFRGCGWYVEITHANNIITRYCHQLVQPLVVVGQQVAAGQKIGVVGTSGNSSGPHLHFEVHINGDNSAAGAIDPIPFMNQQGASLGTAP